MVPRRPGGGIPDLGQVVEEPAVLLLVEEGLALVLAMDVDEEGTEAPKLARRDQAPADGARAAARA